MDGASENWTPVHLPLPLPAMSVSTPFELASGGNFELQIVTSATKAEQAASNQEGPPVEMVHHVRDYRTAGLSSHSINHATDVVFVD